MPMLLRDCFKCRFFRMISYVHPKSSLATLDRVAPGWYLSCQTRIKLDDLHIKHVDGIPWIDYQVLRKFLALNGKVSIECPIAISPEPVQGTLFQYETGGLQDYNDPQHI